ncbi:hypothetical protein H4R19_007125, partial [Coemansia spiralis]
MVTVYVDGSFVNQGRADASAGVGVYFDDGTQHQYKGKLLGSHQGCARAEAEAVRRALLMLNEPVGHGSPNETAVICTDSTYVLRNIDNARRGRPVDGDDDIFGSITQLMADSARPVTLEK